MLGTRPRIFWMRAYSSGVRPCSDASCGVTLISVSTIDWGMEDVGAVWATRSAPHRGGLPLKRLDQGAQDHQAVGPTQRGFDGALGMRHQADHVALAIGDAGDEVERSIGIGCGI